LLPWYLVFLKSLLFAVKQNPRSAIDIRNRPRIPIPDEDPYSIAGSGSSGSSGNGNRERARDKPPKLPPRDNSAIYGTAGMPKAWTPAARAQHQQQVTFYNLFISTWRRFLSHFFL
jgi:hypothetical protein